MSFSATAEMAVPKVAPRSDRIRTAVVGTGSLGRHHVRILTELAVSDLVGIHDVDGERAQQLAQQHGTRSWDDLDALLDSAEAVVIAAPTTHHAEIGLRALERGCHLLVEKPITPTLGEADRLVAAAGDRVLAVGHVEFYNPAVQELLRRDVRPRFIEVQRLSTFTPRSLDVDVVLDLMIHDLQIVQALDPSPVRDLRAVGMDILTPHIDIADVRIELESGCVVKLTASRVSDTRVRNLRVFGEESYSSIDYQAQSLKGFRLEELDSEPTATTHLAAAAATAHGPRAIVPVAAELESVEPLRRELECFLARVDGVEAPLVDGEQGREALALALRIVEQGRR